VRALRRWATSRPSGANTTPTWWPSQPLVGDPNTSELERLCRRAIVIRKPFTFGRRRLGQGAEVVRSLFSTEPYRLRKFRSGELASVLARAGLPVEVAALTVNPPRSSGLRAVNSAA
jgi:hypothetical protein